MDDKEQKPESAGEADKRDYKAYFPIAAAFIGVIFFLIVGMVLYRDEDKAWSYGINLFTSIISTIATVGIIEAFSHQREKREVAEREEANRLRDERNAVLARQRQLIDDAASNVNDVAKNAVYQMQRKGWLEGETGLLKGADLYAANLQGADLDRANLQAAKLTLGNLQATKLSLVNLQAASLYTANLQDAVLIATNLQGVNLRDAKLQAACLSGANLQGADMLRANLQGTDLSTANLQGADLTRANLRGADLFLANLQDARLIAAEFDEQTKLPDNSQWLPETNMRRFTNPNHPEFWRSDYEGSPAYRGKGEV